MQHGDTDFKTVGFFNDGSILYHIKNRAGVTYFIIEDSNGSEMYSIEDAGREPAGIIDHHCWCNGVYYKNIKEEN